VAVRWSTSAGRDFQRKGRIEQIVLQVNDDLSDRQELLHLLRNVLQQARQRRTVDQWMAGVFDADQRLEDIHTYYILSYL
jgi:hypothetical protein